MTRIIRHLFSLLTLRQKRRFFILQFLVVFMSILEIFGVASIVPFMSLVGDLSQLHQDTFIASIYNASNITSESRFVFILGVLVLIMLTISSFFSVFTTWRLFIFANQIGMEISDRLYTHYLKKDWLFHASGSSSQLTKKIATETSRVTGGILVPLMNMNAKIIMSFFMSLAIFFYDPMVGTIGFIVFTTAYIILFNVVRKRLHTNGIAISKVYEQRFRLMNEAFGGIKDLLLLGRDSNYINTFSQTGRIFARSNGNNSTLAQTPRYFMELIAFGSMIILILYLLITHEGNLGKILPVLSVYALASIKLLPAFQQIYAGIASIRGNIPAFSSIEQDLIDSIEKKPQSFNINSGRFNFKQDISLEDVSFTYPGKDLPTINKLSISIPKNSIIGIVGPSGSGKSTIIDILLGLIKPEYGELKIDGLSLNEQNLRLWQNNIGFVAQSIFLSEGTIAENVAFGIPFDDIDINQVQKALKLAHLSELTNNLKDGIYTKVGERGVQLSGGQRQRIGIARALYHEAEVLVFDEATSSLDGITENMIMKAIHDFSGKKTIILIAHRLKTIQKCNQIFYIEEGKLIDKGTFEELIIQNQKFKKMAEHS